MKTEIDTYLEKKATDIVDHMDFSTMAIDSSVQCHICGRTGHYMEDYRQKGGGAYGKGGGGKGSGSGLHGISAVSYIQQVFFRLSEKQRKRLWRKI